MTHFFFLPGNRYLLSPTVVRSWTERKWAEICLLAPPKDCEEDAAAGVAEEPIAATLSAIARKTEVRIEVRIEVRNMTISCGWSV
jgi:hypothetical protein